MVNKRSSAVAGLVAGSDRSRPTGPGDTRPAGMFTRAEMRMEQRSTEALAPFAIHARELDILLVIASREPGSQQQAAQRLGIDRTSTVARIDALEAKGLVSRHPHAGDRRRNLVELTDGGRETVRRATQASERAEAALLASLTAQEGERLRTMLQAVVKPPALNAEPVLLPAEGGSSGDAS